MASIHRYLALFFGLIFILFAYFQMNDPDPVLWVPIFFVPSALSFGVFFKKYNRLVLILFAIVYLVGAILYYPNHYEGLGLENLSMKTEQVEFARESFGLGICFLVFVYYIIIISRAKNNFA